MTAREVLAWALLAALAVLAGLGLGVVVGEVL